MLGISAPRDEGEQGARLVERAEGVGGVVVGGGVGAQDGAAEALLEQRGVDGGPGDERVDDPADHLDHGVGMDRRDHRGDVAAAALGPPVDRQGDEARVEVAAEPARPAGDIARPQGAPGEQVGDQPRGLVAARLLAGVEDRDPGQRRPRRAPQVFVGALVELAAHHHRALDLATDDDRHDLGHPRRPGRQPARDQLGDEAFGDRPVGPGRARPRHQDLDPRADQLGRDRRHPGEPLARQERLGHPVEGGLRERGGGLGRVDRRVTHRRILGTDEPADRLVDRRSNRRRPEVDPRSSRAPILGPRDKRTASDLSRPVQRRALFAEGILRGPPACRRAPLQSPRVLERDLTAPFASVPSHGRRAASLLALGLALLAMLFAAGSASAAPALDLDTLSGTEAEAMLEAGEITSVELTEAYLERIEALNKTGPGLNAVTQINKYALAEAEKSDEERALGIDLGPAMGLPILLKDIIDAKGMYTSAGDWALRDSYPEKDSGVAKELRAHGVDPARQGRPLGVGEQLRQPALRLQQPDRPGPQRDRRRGGSERLVLRLGRRLGRRAGRADDRHRNLRLDHQPLDPQGDVGLRPTLGLVPGYGIAPIDASQDTAGPIVRTVPDAAITLQSIAEVTGTDPEANEEYERHDGPALHGKRRHPAGPVHRTAGLHVEALDPKFVQGKRIGYNGACTPQPTCTLGTSQESSRKPKRPQSGGGGTGPRRRNERSQAITSGLPSLPPSYEAHATINEYYKHLGSGVPVKSLEEEVAVDNTNPQEGGEGRQLGPRKRVAGRRSPPAARTRSQYETNSCRSARPPTTRRSKR